MAYREEGRLVSLQKATMMKPKELSAKKLLPQSSDSILSEC